MNVGINLLFLKPGLAGGTETYSMSLLQAMANIKEENTVYYIFCSSELNLCFLNSLPRFKIVRYNKVSRSLAYRYFFEQAIFPFRLKKYKLNVLHSHGYVGPLLAKNHVVTIHDTNAFAHKEAMPVLKRLLLSFFLLASAKSCRHIITVSQFSKNEIIKNLKVLENKVSVIYEACKYSSGAEKNDSLPAEFTYLLKNGYFMGLSSLSPHKNIQTLLTAYKLLALTNPEIKLVLAGHLPGNKSISSLINDARLNNKIVITGFVDDSTLVSLLKHAICFVFPSLYEGFGLPLLEAQNAGVPVIASDRGSLPEIGGESAIYFPAEDAVALSAKMKEILLDEHKRMNYTTLGFENVKRFSWEKAAKETLKIYETQNK